MTNADGLKVCVLAHDLSDAAVGRRVAMLKEGGAKVTLAGFRRSADPVREIEGCPAVDFGRTYNAGFLQRIWSVIREVILLNRHQNLFAEADVILARNLEMLALAVRGRSLAPRHPAIIYEVLDVHRLLLRRDIIGLWLRTLEGWLAHRAAALFTSSPAFVSEYFKTLSQLHLPIHLIENKVLNAPPAQDKKLPGPPWIIGWFGIIRCKKSLHILGELARQSGGLIEVIIRGRPAADLFGDFEKKIAAIKGVRFLGPYKNPDDLAPIYSQVHFNWTIDMFEEGLNSSWLLPNRLYEGGAYQCVPIAMEHIESDQFIKRLGIGVTLREPLEQSLAAFFKTLTPEKYNSLKKASASVPRSTWVCDTAECKELIDYMREVVRD